MDVEAGPRYRIDELRRLASNLAMGAGLAATRAAALATHLLWYDTAGLTAFGLASLPDWLARIVGGDVDPRAEGRFRSEHAGTAVLDGQRGVAPLILARAAGVAGEKARDLGVGLVRVTDLGSSATGWPAAAVAAELAIGPELGWVVGPGPSWALALPSPEGLPVVFDSALAGSGGEALPDGLAGLASPWLALATGDGWLVGAAAVNALEPLATFHERVAAALHDGDRGTEGMPGLLLPARWEAHRAQARRDGLRVDAELAEELRRWADGLGVGGVMPAPSRRAAR